MRITKLPDIPNPFANLDHVTLLIRSNANGSAIMTATKKQITELKKQYPQKNVSLIAAEIANMLQDKVHGQRDRNTRILISVIDQIDNQYNHDTEFKNVRMKRSTAIYIKPL